MTWSIVEMPGGKTACSVTGSWKLESCLEIVAALVCLMMFMSIGGIVVTKQQADEQRKTDGKETLTDKEYTEQPTTIFRIIVTLCLFFIALALWIWARCGNYTTTAHKA
jgi:hypothetical protein